jgi:hypothetical protein
VFVPEFSNVHKPCRPLCSGTIPSGGERSILDPHAAGYTDSHHYHTSAVVLCLPRVSTVRETQVSPFVSVYLFETQREH